MKQQTLMMVAVAVLLVLGAILYFYVPTRSTVSRELVLETQDAPTSLRALLGMSGAQKCIVASSVSTASSEGVVYIANGKIRGDFASEVKPAGGARVLSHMITDGKVTHVWMDGMTQGYMMSADATNQATPEGQDGNAPETVSLDQEASYSCESWVVDEAQFALPEGIEFIDMAEMMKNMPMMGVPGSQTGKTGAGSVPALPATGGSMGDMKAMQCSACDQAGVGRDDCRAALDCQ